MFSQDAKAILRELVERHKSDRDGGYRLVESLCARRNDFPRAWDEILVEWARDQDPLLWGVALEALGRAGGNAAIGGLSALLQGHELDEDARDLVANALLKRGFVDARVRQLIREGIDEGRPAAVANLALLAGASADGVQAAADTLERMLGEGRSQELRACIAPFAHLAVDVGVDVLAKIVSALSDRDVQRGREFSTMILEYSNQAFMRRRLAGKLADLHAALADASSKGP